MWQCHYCRFSLSLSLQEKNRMCPNCGSDIHSCMNCVHFDFSSNKCKEPDSPWLRERDTENNCTFFEFREAHTLPATSPSPEANSEAERAKEAFRALFRNS
jgi:predicted RNA-binding Zn-ribbon protein involved in translation (DUF1610 family)